FCFAILFPPSPILKSRHSSTKISVTLVRGKASGRVATSRFLADEIILITSVQFTKVNAPLSL
ncbi:hypothetical protein LDA46_12755, partial [Enterococcus faecium]|nr:hypothetical protein [Enterococcus faecium]